MCCRLRLRLRLRLNLGGVCLGLGLCLRLGLRCVGRLCLRGLTGLRLRGAVHCSRWLLDGVTALSHVTVGSHHAKDGEGFSASSPFLS